MFCVVGLLRLKLQFFQFDKDGNMYVFPAGSGCTGNSRLVHPGDELIFSNTEEDSQKVNKEVVDCN